MADYRTQFSCVFDVGSIDNAAKAQTIRDQIAAALDDEEGAELGFEMEAMSDQRSGALWLHAGDYGEPEHVIRFVLACAEAFQLTGRWGFTWALTCSRARTDGFGGGAQLIDLGTRTSIAWMDCEHWLAEGLDHRGDAELTPGAS